MINRRIANIRPITQETTKADVGRLTLHRERCVLFRRRVQSARCLLFQFIIRNSMYSWSPAVMETVILLTSKYLQEVKYIFLHAFLNDYRTTHNWALRWSIGQRARLQLWRSKFEPAEVYNFYSVKLFEKQKINETNAQILTRLPKARVNVINKFKSSIGMIHWNKSL